MFDTNSIPKNNKVKLLDSIMGSSKTSNILKWIDSHPEKKYIFVSPLLSEVDEGGRVHKNLNQVTMEIPVSYGTNKTESMLSLIENGCNIACTHQLYLGMDDRHFDALGKQGYTIIIDEEVDIIGGVSGYSVSDLQWLIDRGDVTVDPYDGMVSWVSSRDKVDKLHKYHKIMQYCDAKALYCTKRSDIMAVTQLPIKLFECAKEVIILTYMFEGNILDSFLRLKGFDVEMFTEVECSIPSKKEIAKLLTIIPPNKKVQNYSLSASWWEKASTKQINDVANYIRTGALKHNLSGDDVLWTVPKDRAISSKGSRKALVKPKGFTQDTEGKPCYLATTVRATNVYHNKKGMFHCFNRYPVQAVRCYLEDYEHPVDQKVFATSELLQWLWRGCIRKGEPMVVGIASKRMYNYFMEWLNE